MGVKIKQIEVENFKSFKERTTIPFSPDAFTVIVGPNGTGKSTCLEAISFVLLANLADLRGVRGDDLLPRGNQRYKDCAVRVMFEDDEENFTLSRLYNSDSQDCKYFFNDKEIVLSDYKDILHNFGLSYALQTSILKQDDIDSLATRSPLEWTDYFEKFSGSDSYKEEYNKTKKIKDKELKQMQAIQKTVNKLKKAMKNKKKWSEREKDVFDLSVRIASVDVLAVEKEIFENITKYNELYDLIKKVEENKVQFDREELLGLKIELSRLEVTGIEVQDAYRKSEESLKLTEKKISSLRESKKSFTARCEKSKETYKQLRDENAQLEERYSIITQELQKDSPDYEIDLREDENQTLAYLYAKEKFDTEAAPIAKRIKNLESKRSELGYQLSNIDRKLDDIAAERKTYKKLLTKVVEIKQKLQEEDDLGDMEKVQQKLDQLWQRQLSLILKLDKIDDQLEEYKQSAVYQAERTRIDSVLKAEFGNQIYGRLVDLCHPVDPKYQVAITKIMGSFLNAIVVQSTSVAIECVELLRKEKLGLVTFMGLDDLEIEDTLTIHSQLTRAYDLLTFDESVSKAVLFAVKDTVVCEDAKTASEIRTKYKVDCVSLSGTLFRTSGLLSGGQVDLEMRSHEWDHKVLEKLRNEQDTIQKELDEVNKEVEKFKDCLAKIELRDKANLGPKVQLKYLAIEEELQKKRVKEMENNVPRLKEEKARLDREIDLLDSEILEEQKPLLALKDKMFQEFCQTYGYNKIQDYEKDDFEDYKKELEKRAELEINQAKIQGIIEMNKTRMDEIKERLEQMQERLEHIDIELEESEDQLPEIRKQFEKNSERKNAIELNKRQLEDEIRKFNIVDKAQQDMERQYILLQEQLFLVKQTIFELKNKRFHILHDAVIVRGLPLNINKKAYRPENLNDDMLTESSSLEQILEPGFNFELDFSNLPGDVKEKDSQSLKEYSKTLQTEMEKLQQNINETISHVELVEAGESSDLSEVQVELDESRDRLKEITQNFEEIGRKRSETLKSYIESIQENLNETYQSMTTNPSVKIELVCLNPEDPFLAGIALYCQVPEKPLCEIKDLSGGEKSTVIFALYLTMNRINSSFLLTDEVDAALDNVNVKAMCGNIKDAISSVQVIPTTFNKEIIANAESLIGTYLDKNGSTKILTI